MRGQLPGRGVLRAVELADVGSVEVGVLQGLFLGVLFCVCACVRVWVWVGVDGWIRHLAGSYIYVTATQK